MTRRLLLTLLLLPAHLLAQAPAAAPQPSPWESEVAAYESADKAHPFPHHAVVFNGSSSIRLWNLAISFPGWKCVNHGIGGSIIPENTALLDRLVFPWEPSVIVFYAGDNDIAKKRLAQQVADDWAAYVKAVRVKLPQVKIIYISIKPSLARWTMWAEQQAANTLIQAQCAADPLQKFIDVAPVLLGEDGLPIKELFREDGLHLLPIGYERWQKLVAPEIEAAAK